MRNLLWIGGSALTAGLLVTLLERALPQSKPFVTGVLIVGIAVVLALLLRLSWQGIRISPFGMAFIAYVVAHCVHHFVHERLTVAGITLLLAIPLVVSVNRVADKRRSARTMLQPSVVPDPPRD
jgi:hypothetical protein